MKYFKKLIVLSSCAFLLFFIASCTGQAKQAEQEGPNETVVPVITLERKDAVQSFEYPASIKGQQNVEIRPKVDGFIEQILVDEGAKVKKGQLLFRIKNPMYEQEVLTAKAAIKRYEAAINTAEMNVNKTIPLVEKGIISEYELEAKNLELLTRKAELEEAKARLQNAKVNLSYTTIYSPSNGVIGTLPYKIGSLVSSTSPQPLTVLSDISNVHVYFSFSEKQYLSLISDENDGTLEKSIANLPPVELILPSGNLYPYKGKVETSGGSIDASTGSISLRAEFPNEETIIRSGSSATIRIARPVENALLVPSKSTYELQGKKFAVKLDSGNVAKSVAIEVADLPVGDFFLVTKGLNPGDQIITENINAIKDGDKIKPQNNKELALRK